MASKAHSKTSTDAAPSGLHLYNTLTRKTEPFKPINAAEVKMFTCGPSTYQRAHIGNYRTFLYEDILQRYLEYSGYHVTRTMALTDVEDKAIMQAKKEGLTVCELTQKNQKVFFGDFELLRIKKPDYPMPASEAIDQAVNLIQKLEELGYAYWHTYRGVKNAYFSALKFKGFGKLSRLDLTKWPRKPRRFHKDTYPGTPWNMGDFILWHGCGLEGTCFETSLGKGRPAWNIQDDSIITKTLGFEIDVACGGIDNLVRHHDYNVAVAEAVSGKQFSRFWLHGGHLYVDGEKMSKSRGNVVYTSTVLERGFSGAELRFFLIYGAYRMERDFTFEKLAGTVKLLREARLIAADLASAKPVKEGGEIEAGICQAFEMHMNSDLDVKGGFDAVVLRLREIYAERDMLGLEDLKKVNGELRRVDSVLMCLF